MAKTRETPSEIETHQKLEKSQLEDLGWEYTGSNYGNAEIWANHEEGKRCLADKLGNDQYLISFLYPFKDQSN